MSADIHKDLYKRLNENTSELARLNGATSILIEQNDKLYKIIRTIIWMMFFVICALTFSLIYGAVGDKGLHAVREAMPHVPSSARLAQPPAPWIDDIKAFFALRGVV